MSRESVHRAHVTIFPNQDNHSEDGRPIVYKGYKSETWWVDDSGCNPNSWDDDWEQSGFDTWQEAIDYALSMVKKLEEGSQYD